MWLQIVLVVLAWLTYIYYKTSRKMALFREMGIPEDPGYFPLGSKPSWDVMKQKTLFLNLLDEQYVKFNGKKMYGWYGSMGFPQLVVQDMELIKDVLIKDFDHFVDRREFTFGDSKYLDKMLTVLTGDKWKTMRTMVSPIFTSGKLKGMVNLIDNVSEKPLSGFELAIRNYSPTCFINHF